VRNFDEASTATPVETGAIKRTPELKPRSFGRRSSTTISHWEGVVETVGDDSFEARLIPYERGVPVSTRVEMASFNFDELVDDSDAKLVAAGANF
jgi:hypothetical protein